jgi:hypothetical protein
MAFRWIQMTEHAAGSSSGQPTVDACHTADPAAVPSYQETLGFRVSDRIEGRFVVLRCSHEHHTVNFTRGPDARRHHPAFTLSDAAHMHRA